MSRFILMATVVFSAIAAAASGAAEPAAAPDGWRFVTVRDDTAARPSVRNDGGGAYGLVIAGNGEAISDGRWVKRVPLPQTPYVNLAARVRATGVEMMAR